MTEFFRLRLACRICSLDEIETWANNQIGNLEQPPFLLCELATASQLQRADVINALMCYPRSTKEKDSAWLLLCRFLYTDLSQEHRGVEETIAALWTLKQLHEIPGHIESEVAWVEDALSLARDGIYGAMEDVTTSTLTMLRQQFERV
ncbi:hypothetical protein EI77_00420 [Prosthecobacter fusiformis]|uniref:Uncharacterized protein n=1 Tax=Prosthecobacter fusiformis TaxID=48464 RepID=A0A4R7SSF9_9BACT|nr:hypothetical protein [Prosthecobacter fusiformis]TDU81118.1 hypothetical protein EI77_00420 [Prosthecobacter fusiformis]